MKRALLPIFILMSCLSGLFTACIDDSFTTSPGDVLTFSTDTVNLDTIFTNEGTSTRTFKVYNRNDKSLRISSISLGKGSSSAFIVNVDGLSGISFTNTEIRGNDSLFVFVIANVAETGQSGLVDVRDSLVFVTNGVTQHVKLLARTQDAKRMRGATLNSDTLLTAEKPFIVYDSLVVAPTATLTIEPGATLYFHNGAALEVYGKLIAEGTPDARVTLRGDRLDRMFDNLPYDNLAGQWGGIRFHEGSFDNRITHAMVRGTTWGIKCDSTDLSRTTLTIHNSIIHNSTANLIDIACNRVRITNSELSDAGYSVLSIQRGIIDVTHCTLVNYYFYDMIKGAIIHTPTCEEIIERGVHLSLNNCLIAGNSSPLSEGDFTGSDVYLNSCLIAGVEGSDDENFVHTMWNGEPMFWLIERENYLYDYRLGSPESSAIGWGATTYATDSTACDMYGASRIERIDVGAYQFTQTSPFYEEKEHNEEE
ncbi:MAG: hypothetical protein IKJ79_01945 [Bacteroidaceae bacterium]|nr:hypothetical protein [Bacteroidaceae bacterium]